MGQKRITRAEAQRGMNLVVKKLEECHSYAGEAQARIRAELGSMSIPPQQERDILENEERMTEHYKDVSEILTTRAKEEAEKCTLKAEDLRSAERAIYIKRRELERLNLEKTDPELDERQWQMLSDIKARLVEYPVLLGEVTGDDALMQDIKKSYESRLGGYEAKLERLNDDVHGLPTTCSKKVSTLLESFAETTVKPAIDIVKLQHERLEAELGEAVERSEQLDRRIEELEAEAEATSAEITDLTMEHLSKEKSLTDEIAALDKKLEAKQEAYQTQKEKHKRETTDLIAQLERARTTAAEEVKGFEEELQYYSRAAEALEKEKEALENSVKLWRERVNTHRQEHDDLKAKYKANEDQLRSAESQAYSLEEELRAEKEATVVVKKSAVQERDWLCNELKAVKEARNSAITEIQSIKSQLLTATNENASLIDSSEREIRSLENQLSTEKSEKELLQQSYEGEIQAVQSQLLTARTDIDSLKQSIVHQGQKLQGEISTEKAEKKSLKETWKSQVQTLESQLLTARTNIGTLQQSNKSQVQMLRGEISMVKAEKESLSQVWEDMFKSLQSQFSTAESEKNSLKLIYENASRSFESQLSSVKSDKESLKQLLEGEVQSLRSQLSSVKSDKESLKQTLEGEVQSLQDQLSTTESEKESLMQTRENESQSFQTQLSSVKSENELLKHSLEKEMQSLRDQLSTANDTNESLVKSKQELEARYCRATESSETKSRLLGLHISILDNFNMEGSESEVVLLEMEKIFGMTEQYPGSATEMASMPKYMPGMTLVGKATELPEPNLAAARRLWISSRCGSLALDVAQAFFMQEEIPSAQFGLLPWIHASLNRAAITMCESSKLTPDLASSLLWILQGLVYTATVAREWPEDHVWNPKIVEILAQITHWLREHVPKDEASFLTMIVGQVKEIVTTHESPSTSVSPNLVSESRRIDSANSDIPDGMAMVIDISGIIILFTADNAFVFGASEVKVMEVDLFAGILIKFDQAVIGLPATLTEIRLLDRHSPVEVYNRHYQLLKSVLTEDRIAVVYPFKRQRTR